MPASPTYPGVYVQEVASGVRTIVGVGTSIALFLGRTKQGTLKQPTLCLNYADFERSFSSTYAGSDLARSVQLFFQNGGTQCYVVRIAKGAKSSAVTLKSEGASPADVLIVSAKSEGVLGDSIRIAVNYNTPSPESTFNLEVFRWVKNSAGVFVKAESELYQSLSMDPDSPRFAVDLVTQNSSLVKLEEPSSKVALVDGYSQSGRPLPSKDDATFRAACTAIFGSTKSANRFRISVDGNPLTDIDISSIVFASQTIAQILAAIAKAINDNLPPGSSVSVSGITGPTGATSADTSQYIHIASTKGDVRIEAASSNDLTGALMLGTIAGGIESSRFSVRRPASTGTVFKITSTFTDLTAFADLKQNDFNQITVDGKSIPLGTSLVTATASSKMYEDGDTTNPSGGNDGVRQKFAILAAAVNAQNISDPTFPWKAEVWGSRLALTRTDGADNLTGSITSSGGGGQNIASRFANNVRYYSLGTGGSGSFQGSGVAGNDGQEPTQTEYDEAYKIVDREVDLFNLLILPHDEKHSVATTKSLWGPASVFCQKRRAFLLIDPPENWTDHTKAIDLSIGVNSLRVGLVKDYSAVFFPRVTIRENGRTIHIGPSGAIAGLMARTDSNRGVWKAPAGTEADLRGVVGLERRFSDDENGVMNPKAINTIRIFPNGIVNWGARTLDGDDSFGSEYKYIPIRRLALFIEESLYRGLKSVVFEPNDEPLWAQIRLNVGAFMHNLFRQGAFAGATPREAYFVKCSRETTTQNDQNLGIVNIWVGFSPLRPAEFVVLYLQQMAGQVEV